MSIFHKLKLCFNLLFNFNSFGAQYVSRVDSEKDYAIFLKNYIDYESTKSLYDVGKSMIRNLEVMISGLEELLKKYQNAAFIDCNVHSAEIDRLKEIKRNLIEDVRWLGREITEC